MDPKAHAEQRVGTTLRGKWKLERLLGVGGMAAVYVGVHKIGRREAIKILHPDVARAPDVRARFEQEAHAVNRFKHPGAVEIRDIDVADDGAPFLVMELLTGEALGDRATRLGGIETPELLRLVDELLDVLVAAHAQGIVHRDIKLDNLFVREDGRLKVLDFGIAHVRAGLSNELKTRIGVMLGTATYMPPEQIKGMDVDGRADLFAVGATMFRLVARRKIHEASNETELLLKMATQPAPPLSAVAPDAPRDLCMVVDRALMFDRARRYPDAATMLGDIRALRAGQPPPYATARAQEPDAPPSMATAVVAPPSVDLPTRVDAAVPIAPPAPAHAHPGDLPPPAAPISGTEPTVHAGMPGPRAEIVGGIGTELNLPTRTTGGGHAIGILDASAPKRSPIRLPVFLVGGALLLVIIGGTVFWALDSSTAETSPAPSTTSVQGGQGHGAKPAAPRSTTPPKSK